MAKQQPNYRNQPRSGKQFQKLSASIDKLNRNLKAGGKISPATMRSTAQGVNSFATNGAEFRQLLQKFSEVARGLQAADPINKINTKPMQNATSIAARDFEQKLTSSFENALRGMAGAIKGPAFKKLSTGLRSSITASMRGTMEESLSEDVDRINSKKIGDKLNKKFSEIQSKLRGFGSGINKGAFEMGQAAQRQYAKMAQGGSTLLKQGTQRLEQERKSASLAYKASKLQQQQIRDARISAGLAQKETSLKEKAYQAAKKLATSIPGDVGTAHSDILNRAEKLWSILKKSKGAGSMPTEIPAAKKSATGDCCEEMVSGLQTISDHLVGTNRILTAIAKLMASALGHPSAGRNPATLAGGGGAPPPLPPAGGPGGPPPIPGGTAGGGGFVAKMASLLGKAGPIGMAILAITGLVAGALLTAFKMTLGVMYDLNDAAKEMAKNTGLSVIAGEKLIWNSYKLLKTEKARYHTVKEIQAAQVAMVKAAGTVNVLQQKGGEELMLQLSEIGKLFGYGVEVATEMHQQFRAMGADDTLAKRMQGNIAVMSDLMGIPVADVMKDMADSAEYMSTFLSRNPDQVAKTVTQVRRLGFTMKQAASITDKVLNLEGFMTGVTETMALGGPNLSKVFYKALAGDPDAMVEEIAKSIGGSDGWNNMDAWLKKSVANTVGMGVDELGKAMLLNKRMAEVDPATASQIRLYQDMLSDKDLADEKSVKAAIQGYELASSVQRIWDRIRGGFITHLQPAFSRMADFFNSPAVDDFVKGLVGGAESLGTATTKMTEWAMDVGVGIIKGIDWAVKGVMELIHTLDKWSTDSVIGRIITNRSELSKKDWIAREASYVELQTKTANILDPIVDKVTKLSGDLKEFNAIEDLRAGIDVGNKSKTEDYSAEVQKKAEENYAKKSGKREYNGPMDVIKDYFGTMFKGITWGAFAGGSNFIRGAGSSTSDSIPARLSVGERVVPADINKQLGGIPNQALPSLIKGFANGIESVGQDSKSNISLIVAALAKRGITEPNMVKAILGNVGKESNFKSQEENLNYSSSSPTRIRSIFGRRVAGMSDEAIKALTSNPEAFAEKMYGYQSGSNLGNIAPGDGWKYRGRGFIQLTGRSNYAAASTGLGDNLLSNPGAALDPSTAAEVTAWYMDKHMGGMASRLKLPGLKGLSFEQALLLASSAVMGSDARESGFGAYSMDKAKSFAEAIASGVTLPPSEKDNLYGANGRLPLSSLSLLPERGINGQPILLNAQTAAAFQGMAQSAAMDGVNLYSNVTDSYRDLDRQKEMATRLGLYSQGGKAAYPGSSNHGWGLAADVNSKGTAGSWLRSNAARFGFGTIAREPWHWEYRKGGAANEEKQSQLASQAADTLPANYLAGQFARRKPYWEGTFANGTEYVNGPGTSRSDSIMARLSVGERVVPASINNQLGGISNQSLPQLAAYAQALAPAILGMGGSNGTDEDGGGLSPTMVAKAAEQSNVVVVNGLQAVVQRLEKISSQLEQEVNLSGIIARKPVGNTTVVNSGTSRKAGAIGLSPSYFEH